ncbi:alpha,alpha-trehalose-phosphate synthase [UDP-forming]-like [Penaeus chinensis]|uniref:alpha,alpha-trehalose-phosphate synthase [UDP-forming]-like n=1 Tax=Penaeus chinensis TaxID=139456 RepID=UPI001FB64B36|nr:alpha,alpha-trehalose-phosphate synthase [UDP-forming]-like [Penaeus chinensis]
MVINSTSPMVVVANRLPFTVQKNPVTGQMERKHCAGGLVTAVAPVVVETKGLWVGWSGQHQEDGVVEIPEANPNDQSPTAGLKSWQVKPMMSQKTLFDNYYNGCCNATFWPLFHSMPDRAIFQQDKWEAYREVNEQFAKLTVEAVQSLSKSNPETIPLVWLHDYHLMMAANSIRDRCDKLGLPIKMAFFLHIPFPSWDIMRLFPWDDELLQGILGCDSVGFHVEDYCLNFIDCCQRRLGCRVDREQMLVEHNGRTVSVHPLPISIPYDRFVSLAEKAPQVVKNNEQEQLLLGVDRLDYTKGLVHRIRAFETLLQKHPEHIEHVTFLQVAVPSRTDVKEYQELKEDLDQLIGRINGRFSTPNWSPIRYIYGCVSQEQLAAFYRDSSVAVVTPLRDGMNLVAKEFVACQVSEPGVLMLSPFAGAGTSMHEALIVNPYETAEFAEVMHRALTMPKDERELRMQQLRHREREHDVNFWLQSFLKSVDCLADNNLTPGRLLPLREEDFSHFLASYVTESSRLALILDYDGTLAPIAPHPDLAQMPEETRRVLERLAHMPDVNVAILSGRSMQNVKSMIGIEGITYAGCHGFEILHPDGTLFMHPIPHEYEVQLEQLKKQLQEEVCRDGAWLEEKVSGITFHYREVPEDKQQAIMSRAHELFLANGVKVYQSPMAYETRPPVTWDNGRAAIYLLRTLFGLDWCDRVSTIFAGDDISDEDAMRALQGMAVTFRVTTSPNLRTAATYRLPNTDAVLTMLKWVEKRLSSRLPIPNGLRSRTTSFSNSNNHSPPHAPSSPRRSRASSSSPPPEPNKQVMVMPDKVYHQLISRKSSPPRSSVSPVSSPSRSTV